MSQQTLCKNHVLSKSVRVRAFCDDLTWNDPVTSPGSFAGSRPLSGVKSHALLSPLFPDTLLLAREGEAWYAMFLHSPFPIAPGPPEMFQITLMTTTSLSFSWQAPAVLNEVLTGYQLSCHSSLQGIPSPQNFTPGPTVNTAVLPNLSPGVRYNCSIVASNSAGRSVGAKNWRNDVLLF